MHLRTLITGIAPLALIAACASPDSESAATSDSNAAQSAATPNVVTVVATEYAFQAPDTIPAGMTTFVLDAKGQDIHHATIARLDSGKTVAELLQAMRTPGPLPAWVTMLGGPNVPDPGQQANATVELTPGNYALLCFVDTPDKVPHLAKGMVHAFTVTAPARQAAPPNANVTLVLNDYSFEFDKPLAAGKHTIKVENRAGQDHEIQLIKLAPGKTMDDLRRWSMELKGPPPGNAVGGTAGMKQGVVNYFDVELTPGEYVAVCYIPDRKDGKPHFMHGMMRQVSIS